MLNCMRKKYGVATFAISLLSLSLQAQIRFIPQSESAQSDFGITYSMPRTILKVEVEAIKVIQKAGPYARYAEKYLGVKDAVMEDKEYYEMGKIKLSTVGVPDQEQTYVIEVGKKTAAPSVQLTPDGVLYSINMEENGEVLKRKYEKTDVQTEIQRKKNKIMISSEDLLMANTTAKMADVVAQQIYRLRESRTGILTGEAENVPSDGEGLKLMLKSLEEEERELVEQFAGVVVKNAETHVIYYDLNEDVLKTILFRFSALEGVVDKDDLSGAPIYLNLKGVRTELPELTDKERKQMEKDAYSGKLGMLYNVPGEAVVELFNAQQQVLGKGKFKVAQYGEYRSLPSELFEQSSKGAPLRTRIEFYPETGAIKEIVK